MLAWLYLSNASLALSQRDFQAAKSKAKQALDLARADYVETAIEAKYTLGLAQALSGDSRGGRKLCEEVVGTIDKTIYPRLYAGALLALAEASLESGDAPGALKMALQAQAAFQQAGQAESEWRTWLLAARASQSSANDALAREQASRAADLLASLKQRWGDIAYGGYLNRPDVKYSYGQLSQTLGSKN